MKINLIKNEKGSVLVVVALAMAVILGFGALAIDLGRVAVEKSSLQNAIDAAALAGAKKLPDTSLAISVAEDFIDKNGYNPESFDITPSDAKDKLYIETKKGDVDDEDLIKVEYTLAKVLGFDSAIIGAIAEASIVPGSHPAAFDYAIFAGDGQVNFTANSSSTVIEGNIYGSNGVTLKKKVTFSDVAKYYSGSASAGKNGTTEKLGSPLPMPTLNDIKQMIEDKGQTFDTTAEFEAKFNAANPIDGAIYVAGTVDLSRIKGKGVIYADDFEGTLNTDETDSICIITNSSDLHFLGGNAEYYGIIYAPNANNVHFSGSNKTIHGKLICKSVTFSGSKQTVIGDGNYGEEGLGTLYGSTVKLTR